MGFFSKLFGKNNKSKETATKNQEVDTKIAASEEIIEEMNEKNEEISPVEEKQEPNVVKSPKTTTKKTQGTKAKETDIKEADIKTTAKKKLKR